MPEATFDCSIFGPGVTLYDVHDKVLMGVSADGQVRVRVTKLGSFRSQSVYTVV